MPSFIRKAIELLEKRGDLLRIKELVSPDLEMPQIARKAYREKMPAIFFENVEGSPFPAVCNLFGTEERANAIAPLAMSGANGAPSFRDISRLFHALPLPAISKPVMQTEISLSQLPQIRCWKRDGGAFITLPQVLTIKPGKKSWMHSNLGMYRAQISGNEYKTLARDGKEECGLHYQINRGIGIHHQEALARGEKLKVSIFIGGHPAHSLAAVMPLPNGVPELAFAGMLAKRAFRYAWYSLPNRHEGEKASQASRWLISAEADFCILGEIESGLKPEGPFGDHLGYYSEKHPFPYLKVHKVFARKDAVFPFTVVGRPPQEDTTFGCIIHRITKPFLQYAVPGVSEVNAVDAAGVHPLLLAIGSERYIPYEKREPLELLTQANAILGFGQLSLAKYLFIAAKEDNPHLSTENIPEFFEHILSRLRIDKDAHFHNNASIDTLDYSARSARDEQGGRGGVPKFGSKVVFAAAGEKIRELGIQSTGENGEVSPIKGVFVIETPHHKQENIKQILETQKTAENAEKFPLVILCDDFNFAVKNLENLLWVTFTRSNPATDITIIHHPSSGVESAASASQIIIDATKKPWHSPELEE